MPPLELVQVLSISCGLCLNLSAPCSAEPTLRSAPLNATWLKQQGIAYKGNLIEATHVFDRAGEHVLVLHRMQGASPSNPVSGRIEQRQLRAVFYTKAASNWAAAWEVNDGVDCPGLDSAADFFTKNVTFTDLNKDGRVEVTLPYYLFCGGGIEPRTVKVILREGTTKLAVRGNSLIAFPNRQPFGGEYRFDEALGREGMSAYRSHLEKIWNTVSREHRK